MGFDVRAFVAIHLGCEASEVVLVAGPTSPIPKGQSASYARRPAADVAAKVRIGPQRQNLNGQVRRLVTVQFVNSSKVGTHTDIGPEDHVDW